MCFRNSVARAIILVLAVVCQSVRSQSSFVNWENPHVHPLDMTPDGTKLLAVNTADNRLEVFDITSGRPVHLGSVPVGLDPVSVRARNNNQAWVVNHISDSVSIVDLNLMNVIETVRTDDEPADVVFAGSPRMAFISCSQANTILRIDPASPREAIHDFVAVPFPGPGDPDPPPTEPIGNNVRIPVIGEEPRALAVSANAMEVYVAIFQSGNRSTILDGGEQNPMGPLFGPSVVDNVLSPYFDPDLPVALSVNPPNPPPNNGTSFNPPINPDLFPQTRRVGLIVKKNAAGQWMDDNNHDWTHLVSGANAAESERMPGWDVVNHDVGVLNTNTLGIRYAGNMANICMSLSVQPSTGRVTLVGTDGTNEIRFEPNLNGQFLSVLFASFDPAGPANLQVVDLNPQLASALGTPFQTIPQAERDRAIGDPRGIAWNATGDKGYITGMGSNNVLVVDANGVPVYQRPIDVGEGPTGIAFDEARNRAYVLNKFAASISIINTTNDTELTPRVPLYDPTPTAIKTGRKHLYNTHANSGLGQVSCASCHVDARMDQLAWDLGDPSGEMKEVDEQNCLGTLGGSNCQPWHPMKGPMTTQTLQDIIGLEPHHWRGDRDGIEEFADAFAGLLGDDESLDDVSMQEFEDFLASIHYPPNPFRNFDNSLPSNLKLTGHHATGRFEDVGGLAAGAPLPNGNAQTGLDVYRLFPIEAGNGCVVCHSLPTGAGPDGISVDDGNGGFVFEELPVGPNGEHRIMLVTNDGSTNRTIKIPHLRNLYEKTGFDTTKQFNTAGFGLLHDGSVDSIARFINAGAFNILDDQMTADLVALMLAFSGSDMPEGDPNNPTVEPPGPPSQDTHAAVGWQTTLTGDAVIPPAQLTLIGQMIAQADTNKVGLIVKGKQNGEQRGYTYVGSGLFASDRTIEVIDAVALSDIAAAGSELTYTVVPKISETRIGVDRDEDGVFDRDELDGCSDPANPISVPLDCRLYGDVSPIGTPPGNCTVDLDDILCLLAGFANSSACPYGDIQPCGGDNVIGLDDILAELNAFAGDYACQTPCGPF